MEEIEWGLVAKKHKRIRFSVPQEVETRPAKVVSEPGRAYMRPEDGKHVPLVWIDTCERPDIESMFALYKPETIGDVAIQWGRRDGAPKRTVTLFIRFIAPVELLLVLDFEVVRQSLVVDGILRAREMYLQGVGPAETDPQIRSSRVRVVVPDTKFDLIWEELLIDELAQQSRVLGATDRHARLIAQESIRRWRAGPH